VSSANLTLAAFKGQLQAAWRACLELRPQRSEARLARWGVLPDFLWELAASAGENERLAPFVELLARADTPEGVTFVASVPGSHSRQALRRTPWGAAGLREIAPPGRGTVRVSILSPFIGWWSDDAVRRWCATFKGSPNHLELVWIDENHPWARDGRWLLPRATWKTLTEAGATLLHLRRQPDDFEETDPFHEEHRPADDRWSHAKVYSLKRGTSRRLLVTSANFSTGAWGSESRDGELTIENFELGVCVEQASWPFEELHPFKDDRDVATVSQPPSYGSAFITWARAGWDGKKVEVRCRCKANRKVTGALNGSGEITPITKWKVGADGRLRLAWLRWRDAKRPPSFVQLTCNHETVSVAVFDERPLQEREGTFPSEVDEDVVQTMLDELLFEQYGGRVAVDAGEAKPNNSVDPERKERDAGEKKSTNRVDPETEDPDDEHGPDDAKVGRRDSYAVPAFVLARRHLRVVDNWAEQVKRSAKRGTGEFERQLLRRDGELLIKAFQRQVERDHKKGPERAIGAKLAVEELTLRLKHLPEA
jgi:Tyrosyl-DNA phosphodiesterase